MPWYLSLLMPFIDYVAGLGIKALEAKYPGIAAIIQTIQSILGGGGSASQLHQHIINYQQSAMSGQPSEPVSE